MLFLQCLGFRCPIRNAQQIGVVGAGECTSTVLRLNFLTCVCTGRVGGYGTEELVSGLARGSLATHVGRDGKRYARNAQLRVNALAVAGKTLGIRSQGCVCGNRGVGVSIGGLWMRQHGRHGFGRWWATQCLIRRKCGHGMPGGARLGTLRAFQSLHKSGSGYVWLYWNDCPRLCF